MSFQHSTANKAASLRSIFDARSMEWVTWECNSDGIAVDISYDWGGWYLRSYVSDTSDTLLGCRFTIVRVQANSLSTLSRRVKLLKQSYRFPHSVFVVQFLTAHFGAFHMYDVDASNLWLRDID